MDDGRLPKRVMFGTIKDEAKKGRVGKRKSGWHACKATPGLSRSNEAGNTQPKMPRAGPK